MSKQIINELLTQAHVDPKSFEAELGLLCHKWMMLKGIEYVIDTLHNEMHALSFQQDAVTRLS